MIVIYELHDLVEGVIARCAFDRPMLSDVNPDLWGADGYAETVYIARRDGRFQMVKARNAPLDPYPVRIRVERPIEDEV